MSLTGLITDPETWLDEHGDSLYSYALMRVQDTSVAEDLVQETLLGALIAKNRFAGNSSERTWLIGILKHKIVDHLRRAAKAVSYESLEPDEPHELLANFDIYGKWKSDPQQWSEPSNQLERKQLHDVTMSCVNALPEKLRTLFLLREFGGLDTNHLLFALNISSKKNLWVMLSRARERLRECLQQNWFGGTSKKC